MQTELLSILEHPKLQAPKLILGFSGWMDGGDVSTGTVGFLIDALSAVKLAEIDPSPFYLYNFPGSMEIASLFRPHVRIEKGLVCDIEDFHPTFYYDEQRNLILFTGKEPNLRWPEFARCIFALAADFAVSRIFFVGSVAGLVPHSREPLMYSSVSDEKLLEFVQRHELSPSSYEGPGSFITYLTTEARRANVELVTLVAGIPGYIQGVNEKCIAAMTRKLAALAEFPADFPELEAMTRQFEERVDKLVRQDSALAAQIEKIEAAYDEQLSEAQDEEMKSKEDELRAWIERQGLHFQ